jgi:hypothetical protein
MITNMKLFYLYTDKDGNDYFQGKFGIYSGAFLSLLDKEETEHFIEMARLKDKYFLRDTFAPTKKVINELIAIERAELDRLKNERAKHSLLSADRMFYDILIENKLKDIEWYSFFKKPKNEKYKDEIDKEAVLSVPIQRFINFNKSNFAPCIFHSEKTPSMKLYPITNTIHCFGCGKTANAIQCMQQVRGCDFKTALQELSKLL